MDTYKSKSFTEIVRNIKSRRKKTQIKTHSNKKKISSGVVVVVAAAAAVAVDVNVAVVAVRYGDPLTYFIQSVQAFYVHTHRHADTLTHTHTSQLYCFFFD